MRTKTMKSIFVISALLLAISTSAFASYSAHLLQIKTDPAPNMVCDFNLILSDIDELEGVRYSCEGDNLALYGVDKPKQFSIQQLRSETALVTRTDYDLMVISLTITELDVRADAKAVLSLLTNAIWGSRQKNQLELQKIGKNWIAYTGSSLGHNPFNLIHLIVGNLGVDKVSYDQMGQPLKFTR